MKTIKNLYSDICSFENLLLAAKKAEKGKRSKPYTIKFNIELEKELLSIQRELRDETYVPGRYKTFFIYEPKKRMISAAPYRDRVVHHALCNIIEPIFERTFIYDSYANRKGKGTHKAINRYQLFSRKNKYVLKCDIKAYFPSIDHEILKGEIRWKIADKQTLNLINTIIDNSNPQKRVEVYFPGDDLFAPLRRKGLPIGNLTSQFFANIYLNKLDHFLKDELGCKYYVRYVDDFVILSNNKSKLHDIKQKLSEFLENYRLKLHPNKCHIFPVDVGITFLGHRVFPYFKLLKKENVIRFKRRIKKLQQDYALGITDFDSLNQSIQSWIGHAAFSHTYRLRSKIFAEHPFIKVRYSNAK